MSEKSSRSKLHTGRILRAFLFLLLFFNAGYVFAQDNLPDSIVTERLQIIKQMLAGGKKNANHWWNGWLIGYSSATLIQGTAAIISKDKSVRQDLVLGAGTTFLGAAGQVLTPWEPAGAPDRLALLPEATQEERMIKLSEAERLLRESAQREKNGRSWKTHALYSLVNLGSGIITWKGFDRNIWAGLENFALNTVITEVQIFTQPTRAVKDYQNYLKKYGAGSKQSYVTGNTCWTVNGYPGGIVVRFNF